MPPRTVALPVRRRRRPPPPAAPAPLVRRRVPARSGGSGVLRSVSRHFPQTRESGVQGTDASAKTLKRSTVPGTFLYLRLRQKDGRSGDIDPGSGLPGLSSDSWHNGGTGRPTGVLGNQVICWVPPRVVSTKERRGCVGQDRPSLADPGKF